MAGVEPAPPLASDRRLWALVAGAAALRALCFAALWLGDPLARTLVSDSRYYDDWARALAAGTDPFAGQPHWMPPLYPWLLSALYRATDGAVAATAIVQLLLGLITLALAVALAERAAGRRAALAAGLLWTLYLPPLYFETRLLAHNVAVPLALAALLCWQSAHAALAASAVDAARARRRGPWFWSFAGGVACGAASMAVANLLIGAPCAAAALLWRGWRSARRAAGLAAAALALAGLAAGIAPSLARNWRTAGAPMPVSANGGLNFYFGNNPEARGTFCAPGPEWASIEKQRDVALESASAALGHAAGEAEAGAYWTRRGLDWIAAEPAAAARLWLTKLADALSSTEFEILYPPDAARDETPLLWAAWLPFGALLALAALGWSAGVRGRGLFVAWLASGLAAGLLFFTYSRFRLPVLPALLPFAGAGLARLIDWARAGAAAPRWPAWTLAAALLAQSFVPFEGRYPEQLRANALVDMAGALRVAGGDLTRAAALLDANALVDMAGALRAAGGDLTRAAALLDRALELVPRNARARTEYGLLELARGDERAAFEQLRAARAAGIDYPPADYNLAWLVLNPRDADLCDPVHAVEILRGALERRTPGDPYWSGLAALLATALWEEPSLATDPREARRLAESVLVREPEHRGATALLRAMDGLDPATGALLERPAGEH
jgi:tetratricopeptide (TPR) repeat protein